MKELREAKRLVSPKLVLRSAGMYDVFEFRVQLLSSCMYLEGPLASTA